MLHCERSNQRKYENKFIGKLRAYGSIIYNTADDNITTKWVISTEYSATTAENHKFKGCFSNEKY